MRYLLCFCCIILLAACQNNTDSTAGNNHKNELFEKDYPTIFKELKSMDSSTLYLSNLYKYGVTDTQLIEMVKVYFNVKGEVWDSMLNRYNDAYLTGPYWDSIKIELAMNIEFNQSMLTTIIEKYGWPSPERLGAKKSEVQPLSSFAFIKEISKEQMVLQKLYQQELAEGRMDSADYKYFYMTLPNQP